MEIITAVIVIVGGFIGWKLMARVPDTVNCYTNKHSSYYVYPTQYLFRCQVLFVSIKLRISEIILKVGLFMICKSAPYIYKIQHCDDTEYVSYILYEILLINLQILSKFINKNKVICGKYMKKLIVPYITFTSKMNIHCAIIGSIIGKNMLNTGGKIVLPRFEVGIYTTIDDQEINIINSHGTINDVPKEIRDYISNRIIKWFNDDDEPFPLRFEIKNCIITIDGEEHEYFQYIQDHEDEMNDILHDTNIDELLDMLNEHSDVDTILSNITDIEAKIDLFKKSDGPDNTDIFKQLLDNVKNMCVDPWVNKIINNIPTLPNTITI